VNVRFEKRIVDILDQVCKGRGENRSSFIRMAVKRALASLSYLKTKEKKALGIKEENRKERIR